MKDRIAHLALAVGVTHLKIIVLAVAMLGGTFWVSGCGDGATASRARTRSPFSAGTGSTAWFSSIAGRRGSGVATSSCSGKSWKSNSPTWPVWPRRPRPQAGGRDRYPALRQRAGSIAGTGTPRPLVPLHAGRGADVVAESPLLEASPLRSPCLRAEGRLTSVGLRPSARGAGGTPGSGSPRG